MSTNLAAQQSYAKRLATVLRRYENEGYGTVADLAAAIGEESRDLQRWASGTKMPAHVQNALLGELPRHLADYLIAPTGLRLVAIEETPPANALRAAASACDFSRDVAERMSDGTWDHQDAEAARQHAQRVITDLQSVAGE